MTNFDSLIQCLLNRQSADKSTREGISGTVSIDNLFVLKGIDGIRVVYFRVTRDSNRFFSTVSEYDDTFARAVAFWQSGESLGDGGEVLGIGKATRAGPSLSFCLVADEIVDVWEYLLELSAEKLSDEGSGKIEDEYLTKPPV